MADIYVCSQHGQSEPCDQCRDLAPVAQPPELQCLAVEPAELMVDDPACDPLPQDFIDSVIGILSKYFPAASPQPSTKEAEDVAIEIVDYYAAEYTECNCDEFFCEHARSSMAQRIASALTSAQQRGAELQREVDAGIAIGEDRGLAECLCPARIKYLILAAKQQ